VLVRHLENSVHLIRQNDHALLAGRLAQEWIGAGGESPPFDVTLGVALHDLAWADADREPRFDPESGGIVSFTGWTDEDREPLQTAGLDLLERISPFAALLGSLHYSRFLDPEEFPRFAAQERERRARLREQLGIEPDSPAVERARLLLRHLDYVSLFLCLTGPTTTGAPDWLTPELVGVAPDGRRYELRWSTEDTVHCAPFPFRRPFVVSVPYRKVFPPFTSEAELATAWRAAEPRLLELKVLPG
jgi:hypothetical protein